jgi:FkbH-like protein
MKLIEAVERVKQIPPSSGQMLEVTLACGFTPLHLLTFLKAHLAELFPEGSIVVKTGLFSDLAGTLDRCTATGSSSVVGFVEWSDLDPRLGIRRVGGWAPRQLPDIVHTARSQAERIRGAIERISKECVVVLALPTLPLPPFAYTPGWQSSSFESELRRVTAELAAELSRSVNVRVISPQRLDRLSPPARRFDVRSELSTGFPYSNGHADALAALASQLLRNPLPKKGLITDLDDTLWKGILGEVGVEGIAWELDGHAQMHGLYQQLLASLAGSGVLLAAASKNDGRLVEEAFGKRKTVLPRERLFPVQAHWGAKSASVAKILAAWNVGPESVVFVDDSPLDLAEVQAAHPEILCIKFPRDDEQAVYQMLEDLRDLFGKQTISAEDEIRLGSLQASQAAMAAAKTNGDSPDRFLQEAGGLLRLCFLKVPLDPRALELLNKTNQFNLNGKRLTEASWKGYLADARVFLLVASYEDKFGPLGKIAILAGRHERDTLQIDHWVMSCRAFSRRIEHACLARVFQRFNVEEIAFDFVPTPRNGPLQSFFAELKGSSPEVGFTLSKLSFLDRCPPVYLRVEEPVIEVGSFH